MNGISPVADTLASLFGRTFALPQPSLVVAPVQGTAVDANGADPRRQGSSTQASYTAPVAGAAVGPGDLDQLASLVEEMTRAAAESGTALEFRVEEDLQRVVVSVVDRSDGTVLRQIPSAEVLRVARMLREQQAGLISTQG